jgi:predicted flap endonuclease-1-like 5' DNA nuclease/cell division protein FtsB
MFQQNVFQGPGTGTFATHTFEILFMLLVAALIGLWLGWLLWSRYRQKADQLQTENASLAATVQALRQEIENQKAQYATTESERAALETRVHSLTWENQNLQKTIDLLRGELDALQAANRRYASELGMSLEPDAPSEEIPMDIEAPTHAAVVEEAADDNATTHAGTETDYNQGTATMLSDREIPVDIALTPEQEDPELRPSDVQSHRQSTGQGAPLPTHTPPIPEGVRFIEPVPRGTMIPIEDLPEPPALDPQPSPREALSQASEDALEPPPIVVLDGPRDDLKVIEGIGPKIEQLLFSKGITTYGQLAATSVQQLKDILAEAGPRYSMHDPGTWSAQALLAANGEWDNLKAYQEFLHGGKRPDK